MRFVEKVACPGCGRGILVYVKGRKGGATHSDPRCPWFEEIDSVTKNAKALKVVKLAESQFLARRARNLRAN